MILSAQKLVESPYSSLEDIEVAWDASVDFPELANAWKENALAFIIQEALKVFNENNKTDFESVQDLLHGCKLHNTVMYSIIEEISCEKLPTLKERMKLYIQFKKLNNKTVVSLKHFSFSWRKLN